MIAPKFMPVVFKQLWRHRVRSVLTLSGVAIAMFLFIAVQTLQEGVRQSTQAAAGDTTLVVYRENRFCPAASRLPQFYTDRIEKIPGVVSGGAGQDRGEQLPGLAGCRHVPGRAARRPRGPERMVQQVAN